MNKNFLLSGLLIFGSCSYLSAELIQDKINKIEKDIKEDGLNLRFNASIKYLELYPIDNKPVSSGEITSDIDSIGLGTVGVSLLPNTWKINISYSTSLYGGDGWNSSQNYSIDEGDDPMELIEFYTRPLSFKFGEFGIGYNKYTASIKLNANHIAGNESNALDRNLFVGNDGNGYKSARYKGKITNLYMTYNIPEKEYLPSGLGLKLSHEKSNHARNVTPGTFIFHPETKSIGIGIGIDKTIDKLKNGFSIKSLFYSKLNNTHDYYDYATTQNKSFTSSSSEYKIAFAYSWKNKNNKHFYIAPMILERKHSDVSEKFRHGSIEIGMIF